MDDILARYRTGGELWSNIGNGFWLHLRAVKIDLLGQSWFVRRNRGINPGLSGKINADQRSENHECCENQIIS